MARRQVDNQSGYLTAPYLFQAIQDRLQMPITTERRVWIEGETAAV
jgi:hypothetical protein